MLKNCCLLNYIKVRVIDKMKQNFHTTNLHVVLQIVQMQF